MPRIRTIMDKRDVDAICTQMEVSVHLDLSEDLPADRYYVEINIPDKVEMIELKTEDLPDN